MRNLPNAQYQRSIDGSLVTPFRMFQYECQHIDLLESNMYSMSVDRKKKDATNTPSKALHMQLQ
jgi:hypothetical protein